MLSCAVRYCMDLLISQLNCPGGSLGSHCFCGPRRCLKVSKRLLLGVLCIVVTLVIGMVGVNGASTVLVFNESP